MTYMAELTTEGYVNIQTIPDLSINKTHRRNPAITLEEMFCGR